MTRTSLLVVALLPSVVLGCSSGDTSQRTLTDANGGGARSGSGGQGTPAVGGQGAGVGSGGAVVIIDETGGSGTGTGGTSPAQDCDATLELILRDFNSSHLDFQAFNGGQDAVGCGMVMPDLDVSGGRRVPKFQNGRGTQKRNVQDGVVNCMPWDYDPPPEVTSASTFAEWYTNVEGVNVAVEHSLPLTESSEGTYVYDSVNTAGFFPLDGQGLNEVTEGHNFHFTTEAHVRFSYEAGQNFTFGGDDDLWIFVNGKLALDLGGLHGPITATLDFDAKAEELGIVPGNTYNMDIFHAERHTSASNFRVETNISCFEPVPVKLK